ncbi:hypothetical protein C9374_008431 [Naegleria lovaniensis]|uniref:Uncharacterized protein n=1 Tax=Naegleria lovaniensis TaxID=51637 RepID=A0AA88GGV6_NAELO|nr:uncharacterized protein C9374_008431 [Naegleria lovaniensis]KAG2378288.1 hypothetical protein C9374_008431 [Naegleria lovaniensis]
MGCDQSKQQDVSSSKREKTTTANNNQNSGQAPSNQTTPSTHQNNQNTPHSNPLTAKTGNQTNDDPTVAKSVAESWTDFRMKEREMFDKILNKTTKKFIYVSHSPNLMGGGDYDNMYNGEEEEPENEERMKQVDKLLKDSNIFSVPISDSIDNQGVIEYIIKTSSNNGSDQTSTNHDDTDITLIKRIEELTVNALKNVKINEQLIGGELVVQLPTLGAESE